MQPLQEMSHLPNLFTILEHYEPALITDLRADSSNAPYILALGSLIRGSLEPAVKNPKAREAFSLLYHACHTVLDEAPDENREMESSAFDVFRRHMYKVVLEAPNADIRAKMMLVFESDSHNNFYLQRYASRVKNVSFHVDAIAHLWLVNRSEGLRYYLAVKKSFPDVMQKLSQQLMIGFGYEEMPRFAQLVRQFDSPHHDEVVACEDSGASDHNSVDQELLLGPVRRMFASQSTSRVDPFEVSASSLPENWARIHEKILADALHGAIMQKISRDGIIVWDQNAEFSDYKQKILQQLRIQEPKTEMTHTSVSRTIKASEKHI